MKNHKQTIAFTLLLGACSALHAQQQEAIFSHFTYEGHDARFERTIDHGREYFNPILAGFYPDPSICYANGTYYLVNSSFSFYPGVPIFESTNLRDWRQLGHVLDRPSQLPLKGQDVSGGIFAPDITYNPRNKTFYMITTNVGTGNFFVKTRDPHQGWSEPIYLPQIDGIDPSFCFDKDGRAYIVHNAPVMGGHDYEGQRAIRLLEFDVEGDSIKGGPYEIVRGGTHVEERPIWIEGPHLYRIGKYYYLMCAEGGTGDWHSEVIFRAPVKADITRPGSWEECPHNPILTQRHLPAPRPDMVTSAGHADLVQTPQGEWYAVFLACRAYDGPYYNTGRDTYMLPVTWTDGWPVILPPDTPVPTVSALPRAVPPATDVVPTTGNFTYTERFDGDSLDPRWIFLRNPSDFYTTGAGGLRIVPKAVNIGQKESPSALFFRQQHTDFSAQTRVEFIPASASQLAGLALLQNERYNFVYGITLIDGHRALTLTRAEGTQVLVASAPLPPTGAVELKVEGRGRYYTFSYSTDGEQWHVLAQGVDALNLSTARSNGFIGACIGLYATLQQ